ncbi:hypothetical protein SAMN05216604_11831 [Pseudomonas agarici]|nr:hypothetical protein SAMN05216604_11831 [Pseudomonas agarici]
MGALLYEGTLSYHRQQCHWQIRAGATGIIRCPTHEQYFACESCRDLFENTHDPP